jgi:hypothetical protein
LTRSGFKTIPLENKGDGMKPITIIIIFIFACLTTSGIEAEIYSWTDENGVRHYSNTPPADRAAQIKTAREIPPGPEVSQTRAKIDQENFEAVFEELDKAKISRRMRLRIPAAGM